MADTKHKLKKYKQYLETYPDGDKVLSVLKKLEALSVSIALLQDTGIGKLINGFRKKPEPIGTLAKSIVAKWKSVVTEEDKKARTRNEQTAEEQYSPEIGSSEKWPVHYKPTPIDNDNLSDAEYNPSQADNDNSSGAEYSPSHTGNGYSPTATVDYIPGSKRSHAHREEYVPSSKSSHGRREEYIPSSKSSHGRREEYVPSSKNSRKTSEYIPQKKSSRKIEKYVPESENAPSMAVEYIPGPRQHGRSSNENNDSDSEEYTPRRLSPNIAYSPAVDNVRSDDDDDVADSYSPTTVNKSDDQVYDADTPDCSDEQLSDEEEYTPKKPVKESSKYPVSYTPTPIAEEDGYYKSSKEPKSHKNDKSIHSSQSRSDGHSSSKSDKHSSKSSKSDKHSSKSDKHRSENSSRHSSNSDKPRSKSDKHSSDSDKHRSESSKHKHSSNSDKYNLQSSKNDKHSSKSEKHSSKNDKHSSKSDKHSSKSDKHSSNSEKSSYKDTSSSISPRKSINGENKASAGDKYSSTNSDKKPSASNKHSSTNNDRKSSGSSDRSNKHPSASSDRKSSASNKHSIVSKDKKERASSDKSSREKRKINPVDDDSLNLFSPDMGTVVKKAKKSSTSAKPSPSPQSSNSTSDDKKRHSKGKSPSSSHSKSTNNDRKEKKQNKGETTHSEKGEKRKKDGVDDDVTTGFSFDDFLNCDVGVPKKKPKKNLASTSAKAPGMKWSSSLTTSPKPSTSRQPNSDVNEISLPYNKQKVDIQETDILSLLPETSANYKPLLRVPEPRMDIATFDPMVIGTKQGKRTQVYSGRKHGMKEMKSLFNLCIQVLIDHIDSIDYVGGIPYDIMKPVLAKCSVNQLLRLEDLNPHFVGETEELWEIHCEKNFRNSEREEMESWRELYMRMQEEREAKLLKVRSMMNQQAAAKPKSRQVQLAYVDSYVKPPRDVLRKQQRYGTGRGVTANSSSVRSSSQGSGSHHPRHNPQIAVTTPRAVKQVSPMMQKINKLLAKRRR